MKWFLPFRGDIVSVFLEVRRNLRVMSFNVEFGNNLCMSSFRRDGYLSSAACGINGRGNDSGLHRCGAAASLWSSQQPQLLRFLFS